MARTGSTGQCWGGESMFWWNGRAAFSERLKDYQHIFVSDVDVGTFSLSLLVKILTLTFYLERCLELPDLWPYPKGGVYVLIGVHFRLFAKLTGKDDASCQAAPPPNSRNSYTRPKFTFSHCWSVLNDYPPTCEVSDILSMAYCLSQCRLVHVGS
jgi:hypothetical protein